MSEMTNLRSNVCYEVRFRVEQKVNRAVGQKDRLCRSNILLRVVFKPEVIAKVVVRNENEVYAGGGLL